MHPFFRNTKIFCHLRGVYRLMLPGGIFRRKLSQYLDQIPENDRAGIQKRVDYYNKLTIDSSVSSMAVELKDFKLSNYKSAYFYDAFEFTRFFEPNLKADFLFGDITFIPEYPAILKSRPIAGNNHHSVLLNLNKCRHFNFISDTIGFDQKKDELVWRGHVSGQKQARIEFLKKYFDHPFCNIGNTNNWKESNLWQKERMSIKEQLNYKFILCLEGVDVATNLKWAMSSNSLAVMPTPKYETWFMEGKLQPDVHYVHIKDDFSNLEEKLSYYSQNRKEAEAIIRNAHNYICQFRDQKREKLISLKVLQKYFEKTGQL